MVDPGLCPDDIQFCAGYTLVVCRFRRINPESLGILIGFDKLLLLEYPDFEGMDFSGIPDMMIVAPEVIKGEKDTVYFRPFPCDSYTFPDQLIVFFMDDLISLDMKCPFTPGSSQPDVRL